MKPAGALVSPSVETLPIRFTLGSQTRPELVAPEGLLAALLDQITCALLIVDRHRRIAYANETAQDALADGTYLRRFDGLLATQPAARPGLAQAIASVLEPNMLHGEAARSIILPGLGRAFRIAYVRPLPGWSNGCGITHALVALPVAAMVRLEDSEAFSQSYGLTPMEQRVLVHVVNGMTLKATAVALRIASATATTHLKHIFDKTGVRRQSEIVALFLQSLPPLRL